MAGVVVTADQGGETGVTNSDGYYETRVPFAWSGRLIARRSCFTFEPREARFERVESDLRDNNFVATPLSAEAAGNHPPTASAGVDLTIADANGDGMEPITLDAAGSSDSDGAIVSFDWFEGGELIAAGRSVTVSLEVGTHDITLRVADDAGAVAEDTLTVRVVVLQPDVLYVSVTDPAASDDNPGTEAAPFKSIQAAAETAKPGDTVLIKAGAYRRRHVSVNARVVSVRNLHGTREHPITFTNFENDAVIISGSAPDGRLTSTGWEMIDCSWIVISGLTFSDFAGVGLDILATSVGGSHDITVEDCTATRCSQGPNSFVGALRAIGPVLDITFRRCMVYDSNSGIVLRESPVQTRTTAMVPPRAGNSAPGTPACGYSEDMPEAEWDAWPGWIEIAPRRCLIEDGLFFNNRHIPEHSDGIGTRYTIDCTVRNNVAFGNGDDNYDMLGATRMTFSGNIAFSANPDRTAEGDGNGIKIGVRGALDCLIADNVSFDNTRMGIDMGDTERGRVYHNTLVNNGRGHPNGFGLWFEGGRSATGHSVLNNVLARNGLETSRGDFGADKHVRFAASDYNVVSDANNHNFAGPLGSHTRTQTTPRFIDENRVIDTNFPPGLTIAQRLEFIRTQVRQKFGPASDSPLIDSGTVIPNFARPASGAAPDIGAIEAD